MIPQPRLNYRQIIFEKIIQGKGKCKGNQTAKY